MMRSQAGIALLDGCAGVLVSLGKLTVARDAGRGAARPSCPKSRRPAGLFLGHQRRRRCERRRCAALVLGPLSAPPPAAAPLRRLTGAAVLARPHTSVPCRPPRPPRGVRLPQLRLELRRRRRRRRRCRLRFVGLLPRASRNLLPLGWSGRAARRHRPPRLDAHRPPCWFRRGRRTVSAAAPFAHLPTSCPRSASGEALL